MIRRPPRITTLPLGSPLALTSDPLIRIWPRALKFAALISGLCIALLKPTSPGEATLVREMRPLGACSAAPKITMFPPTTERLWPAGICSVLPRIEIGAGVGVRKPKEDGGATVRTVGEFGFAGKISPPANRMKSEVLT